MIAAKDIDRRAALAAIAAGCAAAAGAMFAPVGDLARIALAAAAGIVIMLTVGAVIVVARGIAARPGEDGVEEEYEADTLTLRREDMHPDAPPRRPIFAVSDLGTPEAGEESIPDLLERFEQGLARRTARGQSDPDQNEAQPDVDEALRDALGTLKQMASRAQ